MVGDVAFTHSFKKQMVILRKKCRLISLAAATEQGSEAVASDMQTSKG